jgi:hypothetical protein
MQYWAIPLQRFYRGRYDPDGRPIRGGITVVAREAELLAVTLKTGIIRKMAGIVFAVTMCAFVFSGSPTAAVGKTTTRWRPPNCLRGQADSHRR